MSRGLFVDFAPKVLAEAVREPEPFEVTVQGERISLEQSESGLTRTLSDLVVTARVEEYSGYGALNWQLTLENRGTTTLGGVELKPFRLLLDVNPSTTLPRVRHLSGSRHFDASYPAQAFRVQEEAFMTHDHSRPVIIGGEAARDHVPIMQFALDREGELAGFFVGFEWSAGWEFRAGWETFSFAGEEIGPFLLEGEMTLGEIELAPGASITTPRVHVGFFTGESWTELDNLQRRYLKERLAPEPHQSRQELPVSYNHWFGIYLDFGLEDLKRQAKRAAELGCEYFCLDASWYRTSRSFLAGVGNWNTPDPRKFPKGSEDIRELSAFVRDLGMGFGFWHLIQLAMVDTDMLREHPELYRASTPGSRQPQAYRLRLETPEGEEFAYQTLRRMIDAWNVTWMRYESVPENGLRYNQGYYRVIDRLRKDVPELYIEICNGGGMRLDLGSVARVHGNWLSDHTSDPEVCRFMQTGALRFWPPDYLNLAVTAFRGRGGETATEHQVLSRMVGVLSFSGAIAEWSDDQTRGIRALVDLYKEIRNDKRQPVFFPLPQPRRVEDWDAVVFGDGRGPRQLLFVFRTAGAESVRIRLPEADGSWRLQAASGTATLEEDGDALKISLSKRSGALWMRQRSSK